MQNDLFASAGIPMPRSSYPDTPGYSNPTTSKAAAKSIKPGAGSLAASVYAYLLGKPSTCFEIEGALDLSHQTASARITGLRLAGKIIDSGARRPTDSGRAAIVWKVIG